MIILPINVETPSKFKLIAAGGTRRIAVTSCVLCLYMQCQIVRYTHTLSTLIGRLNTTFVSKKKCGTGMPPVVEIYVFSILPLLTM